MMVNLKRHSDSQWYMIGFSSVAKSRSTTEEAFEIVLENWRQGRSSSLFSRMKKGEEYRQWMCSLF